MPSTAAAALACAVLVLTTACSARQDPPPQTGAEQVSGASSLSATLTRYSSDVIPRRVQVQVHQGDGPAVRMSAVEVRLPGFAGAPRRELDTLTRPAGAVDLPVPLGPPRCSAPGEDAPDEAPVAVRLEVGPDEWVDLEASDRTGMLARLHAAECAVEAVLAQVDLAWGETWTPRSTDAGLVNDGTLRVGPVAPGHTLTVVGVEGTVLLTPTASSALPVEVGAGDVLELPVTMAPARCDAHAVGEAKRGYSFRVLAALDGPEPAAVVVEPSASARSLLEGALLDACGLR